MVKLIMLMARREGMSVADFRAYYEQHHRHIGVRYNRGALRYTRRYIDALPAGPLGDEQAPGFDVMTEIWFEDEATLAEGLARISTPEAAAEIGEDSARLFAPHPYKVFVVHEEHVDDDL